MKNDTITTFLNFVLAALVILGVMFAYLTMERTRNLRRLAATMQLEIQKSQFANAKAQQLLQDAVVFNATAKNPDLARIIQAAQAPAPAAK